MAVAIGNRIPKGIDIRPNHQQGIERRLAILALNHMDGIDTVVPVCSLIKCR